MGLLSFSGGDVRKKEIAIAKNYLTESELKILNNIVSAYFDLAEVKAMNLEPMQMQDWIIQLDRMIETFDKKVLTDAGSCGYPLFQYHRLRWNLRPKNANQEG